MAPDMESMAQSTMSAPAAAQASCVATPVPAVSCVCTCSTWAPTIQDVKLGQTIDSDCRAPRTHQP